MTLRCTGTAKAHSGIGLKQSGLLLAVLVTLALMPDAASAYNYSCPGAVVPTGHCYAIAEWDFPYDSVHGVNTDIDTSYTSVPMTNDFINNEVWANTALPNTGLSWVEVGDRTGMTYNNPHYVGAPFYFAAAQDLNGNYVETDASNGPAANTLFHANVHGVGNGWYEVDIGGAPYTWMGNQRGLTYLQAGVEESDNRIYNSGNIANLGYVDSSNAAQPNWSPSTYERLLSSGGAAELCGRYLPNYDQYFVTTSTYGGTC